MLKKSTLLFIIIIGFTLVGCSNPSEEYSLGDTILTESFNEPKSWEYYDDSDTGSRLEVLDGAYQIQTEASGYIWGLNEQNHSNVVMEVTTNQLSEFENNAYGIMCRADESNNGDGYYFLISGDGFYSIAKGEGDDVNQIVDWTTSSTINKGSDRNTMRAVCIDDYLALYVNDKFVVDAHDSSFIAGYAGFVGTVNEGGDITVSFDDLTIWEASLASE